MIGYYASQVTSNPYGDPNAIRLVPDDFACGSLKRTSFARPGKLFTANASLIGAEVGRLNATSLRNVLDAVISLLKGSKSEPPNGEAAERR